jgi:hypothetical protein
MRCKEIQPLLVEYHDDSLDPEKREKVERHLAECENCRLSLKRIDELHRLLAEDSVPQPEESFWINFLPEVRSRIEAESKPKFSLFPRPRLAFSLMSVLVVMVLSLFLLTGNERNVVELRTESIEESILPESDLYPYTDQLAEVLSEEKELSIDAFLSNGEGEELELTERILEEDYLSEESTSSILSDLSVEELKQVEESIKTLKTGDIL